MSAIAPAGPRERLEPGNGWHIGRLEPTAGDDDPFEGLRHARMLDQPATVAAAQTGRRGCRSGCVTSRRRSRHSGAGRRGCRGSTGSVRSLSCSRSLNEVRIRLVLVCMVGQTPLMPSSPVHCPPRVWLCSKIVGSNPATAASAPSTRPPGPAPITATLPVIFRTVAYTSITLNDMPETSYAPCGDLSLAYQVFGDGPVDLVWAWVHLPARVELMWSLPEFSIGRLPEEESVARSPVGSIRSGNRRRTVSS